ncbi:MAG: hypothetical protein GXY19_00980, partial [Phycisphaerae bacterium]|nr:hypothetical protein [Phycisphaerae bacterium]
MRTWLANPEGSWTRHIGAFLLLVAMGIALPLLIAKGYERMIGPEANPWLMISFSFALRAGSPLALAAFSLRWAVRVFRGPRLERLMIRYHDELGSKGDGTHVRDETAADAWIGSAGNSLLSRLVRYTSRKDYALKAQTDRDCVALARASVKRQKKLSFFFLGVCANFAARPVFHHGAPCVAAANGA